MKVKDMRTKSDKELSTMLSELRTKLAATHVDMRIKETPNVKAITGLKKDIARVLTLQRFSQLEAASKTTQPKEMEKTNE